MHESASSSGGGRPRSDHVTKAILQAAADLIQEVGFDRLTIADIATRAKCGRGAIYRRWPTKDAVGLAALRETRRQPLPLGADPRANVEHIARHISTEIGSSTELITGFIAASRHDPDFTRAMRERLSMPDRLMLQQQITDVIGDNPAIVNFLADAIPGVALLRSLIFEEDTANDDIMQSINQILDAAAISDAPVEHE